MLPTHLCAPPATPALSEATGLNAPQGEAEGVSQGQAAGQLALPQLQRGRGQHLEWGGQAELEALPRGATPSPPHDPAQTASPGQGMGPAGSERTAQH